MINVAMKESHYESYRYNRATMGLGWGAFFPSRILDTLKEYTDVYGEDEVYKRETERIFTYLNYPQKRLILPIQDLPSAFADDRLWKQPEHQKYKQIAEDRCKQILE